ncbi:coat F domain-containing protein [Desulfitobacterium dichloroeliminans LMG P-21439]|uniref:Coat F domain-containing protein n=1 Tax=Desulfitobacterium dichloroeliminans (strain LMG P-21439 / DCA1) TaxID=871963 RepID=L0F883_DESDL|nr:spore coat protein [Desulfitobacterium dichloroeliminans]AGA69407.1 coat F domain-containing protein [Desulfitobacterium dichloroeliminans LMG P-21439]
MPIQLSQKERLFLQDLKSHEDLCIQKYSKYANEAECSNLKQIFQKHASHEQQHYETINQIIAGQVPAMNQGQPQQQAQGMQAQASGMQGMSTIQGQGNTNYNQNDFTLVNDMLSTEKYISGTYDTSIFEFQDKGVRQSLNHIQKEEQEHGEELFNYMKSHGMYNIQ